MRYAVLGGDIRFAHLVALLRESGRDAVGFLQEKADGAAVPLSDLKKHSCIISNWPMRAPLSDQVVSKEDVLECVSPGSVLLFCGPGFPKERRWDLQYVNLWEDEILLRENAYLTAEGAVASAMRSAGGKLTGVDCLVVGYGRIGRALTGILLNMGANVTVISSSENKRREVRESGGKAASMMELMDVLPGKRIIFSTPPAMFIDRAALSCVDGDAIIIDLASPPYGVDLEAAQELKLHAYREPGLPGRYCPLSAARAIWNSVLRWEEAEGHE